MELLSKDQILSAKDLTHEDVVCPEWDGVVRIRVMQGYERDDLEAVQIAQKGDLRGLKAMLVCMTACDEQGNLLFNTDEDKAALDRKSAAGLDRLATVAMKINGISGDDVDELVGNLDAAQSGDSGSN